MAGTGGNIQTPIGDHEWNLGYELRAIALLSIGFGLVGLDRFIINPLFPLISEDLGLTYQDLGLISGALALTWGISSVFSGSIADRIGPRRVLVTSVIAFSLLVACSGLATGLYSLLVIRALMGFAEGGYVPASIVSTVQASKPSRIGLNIGIQQMAAPLVGLGLGPIIAVGLLAVLPSWEWVFGVVAIPGFIVAFLIAITIRSPKTQTQDTPSEQENVSLPADNQTKPSLFAALSYRNVIVATLGMFCFLATLHTLSTFMPSYMTDYMKLPLEQMGFVLAALGLGGFIGMVAIPALSDALGRKITMVSALVIQILAIAGIVLVRDNIALLAVCLFLASFLVSGVVATNLALVNTSVPRMIAASATGLVAGIGEILGGAALPATAGALANVYGIQIIPLFAASTAILGLAITLFGFKEPPRPNAR